MTDPRVFTLVWWFPYISKAENWNLWAKIILLAVAFLVPCGMLYVGFNLLSLPYLLRIGVDGWCAYWWGTEIVHMANRLLCEAREEIITRAIAVLEQSRETLLTILTHRRLEELAQRNIPHNDPLATMVAVLDVNEQQTPRNPLQEVLAGKYIFKPPVEE